MLETKFGPMARDGDFVTVVDFDYMKRKCETYVARVYRGKAYTGIRKPGTDRYIHKTSAISIIPENFVDEEIKRKIIEDIVMHNRVQITRDLEGGILWER